jgi:hypothetical protein
MRRVQVAVLGISNEYFFLYQAGEPPPIIMIFLVEVPAGHFCEYPKESTLPVKTPRFIREDVRL